MKKILFILITISTVIMSFNEAEAQSYMSEEGYVEFVSRAPLLEFKGTSNQLTGLIDLDENLIDFYVDLNTIDTGIERRNRDMRNSYLNTDQFPFAEFTGKFLSSFDPERNEKQEVETEGIFTIHGVEREMVIEGTLEPRDDGVILEASWSVLLEDHDIDRPGILFYELADEQKVNISIHLKNQ